MNKPIHKELDLQVKELTAQVERLRNAAYGMLVNRTGMDEWYDLEKAYRETPSVALATLKAKYQADIITELQNHMINNGYNNEADGVSTWFKEHQKKRKCTHE